MIVLESETPQNHCHLKYFIIDDVRSQILEEDERKKKEML